MQKFKEAAIITVIIVAVLGAMGFLIYIAFSQQARFAEESKQECAKVARLSSADDYHYDSYTCYLIKGNKLETVEL